MAEAISMSTPVTVEAFVEELTKDPMKDWYTMGFLLGLYENTLKDIMWEHRPNGIDACLREIYKTLVEKQGVKLTWEQIIDALSTAAMDNKNLAEEINQKYCGGKYTTTHGTYEECRKDEVIAIRLLKICRGQEHIPGINHNGDGFFNVKSIIKKKLPDITIQDIRRVVANTPALKLDRGKPLSIRAQWGHMDEEIKAVIEKEKQLLDYLSAVCRFGRQGLHVKEDGSFSIKEIKNNQEIQIIKAVKNSGRSEFILFKDPTNGEQRIKHAITHPPEAAEGGGRCRKTEREMIWSDTRTCCCRATSKNIPYDKAEGYLKVIDIAESISGKEKHVTEDDVIDAVEDCPRTCKPGWLKLRRSPHEPVEVKATWGHLIDMPVERPCTTLKLDVADCPPLVLIPINRKLWAEQKKHGIVPTSKYKIHLFYNDNDDFTRNDKAILEKYGCYCVIVIINVKKAIEDGLEFHCQGGERIICMKDLIPVKYFKKIL